MRNTFGRGWASDANGTASAMPQTAARSRVRRLRDAGPCRGPVNSNSAICTSASVTDCDRDPAPQSRIVPVTIGSEALSQMTSRHVVAALALAVATSASAGVIQVTSAGFLVRHEASVKAPPAKVYAALVEQVGMWWDGNHTYSGEAKNLSIDPRPGGCFCESLNDGGGIEHMRVVYVAPGEVLRMFGALGPLQASGVAGSLTWKVTGAASGSRVELSYGVGGYLEGGFEKSAPAVDRVLGEQLQRLKLFIETGAPSTAGR